MMQDLFGDTRPDVKLAEGAVLLAGFATAQEDAILHAVEQVAAQAPFRHMITPGGHRMSVAMSSCGEIGWVTDRRGYRYSTHDPETGNPWPVMPELFRTLAQNSASAAGFPDFMPDACLMNRYEPGAKLSLHQDKDEADMGAPIVSVSLGLPAVFQFGGLERNSPIRKYTLLHGDVVVWGGASRLFYHGILPLKDGLHPRLGTQRINLTFRKTR